MRLIDADALILDFCDNPSYSATMFSKIRNRINNAPTIDAVPVVRCEDCKFHELRTNEKMGISWHYCKLLHVDIDEDDFCSYGERKDGADVQNT